MKRKPVGCLGGSGGLTMPIIEGDGGGIKRPVFPWILPEGDFGISGQVLGLYVDETGG